MSERHLSLFWSGELELNRPGNASLGFQLCSLVFCLIKTFYIGCFFCAAMAPYSSGIRCCRLGLGLAP